MGEWAHAGDLDRVCGGEGLDCDRPSSRPRSVRSDATSAGSLPRAASVLSASPRLTVEMVAPPAIASATTSAPDSFPRWASNA
jgi:hypothetical protein